MIPYGRQDITQADIDAVVEVLRSDFLTQGPVPPRFEQAVARYVGAQHAIAVNSATSALHIACLALDVGAGDLLWTAPNTFVASANCGRYCGADVDFVDIDPQTWNISVAELARKLTQAKRAGRLPKVVVPVHFAGQPSDQEAIWALAQEYGFKVLEDCSHSIGASRNGVRVGGCQWAHIAVFSFHPVKIITSGEGGMALTNDSVLAQRMSMLRTHGITRDQRLFVAATDEAESHSASGAWCYQQQMLGFNYRMTDLQAALGLSQLQRIEHYVEQRNVLARRYDAGLQSAALQLPKVLPQNRSAFHLYVVHVRQEAARKTRRQAFDELRARGVGVNVHYTPVHLQPYYRELGFARGQYPHAEAHGRRAITLPLHPGLSVQQQDQVIAAVLETVGS